MSADFATEVVRHLTGADHIAYWAGGCVRDYLRGVTPKDYDVATTATPQQVRKLFGYQRTLAVGESFGVVIVLGERGSGDAVEVATFRREGDYLDGRRPASVEFCSAEEDASRRDFTINGMFYDPVTEQVHDFVGGQADLQRRIIRAIGDPYARMTEDKLRMLRAVRFASSLEFELDPATASAVNEMADQVQVVSAERISQELRRMLVHPQRARAVRLCEELGLLRVILPEVFELISQQGAEAWQRRLHLLTGLVQPSFSLGMAALLRDVPSPAETSNRHTPQQGSVLAICRRLRFSNDETERICWLTAQNGQLVTLPGSTPARLKRLAVHPDFAELLQLERTNAAAQGDSLEPYDWIQDQLAEMTPEELNPPPLVSGKDLLQLGFTSGPRFKDWLTVIRDAQLNGGIRTQEEALNLARRLAAEDASPRDFGQQTGKPKNRS